jgi:glycosyltransferase involved in cell wall biosynthesis
MKVLIAAASFASNISGLQRHAFNVARCLLPQSDISELHLVVAPWQSSLPQAAGLNRDARLITHVAGMNRGSLSRNLWYYRKLPELAAQVQADLVHLTYPMPVNAAAFHCPTVLTLHDLYPYEIPMNFGFPRFIFNRIVLQQCMRNVNAIACVSDITRLRLKQYAAPAVWKKAVRIYNCVEPEPACAKRSPIPNWRSEPFLLCVAQHRRNKNIPLLIRTFDRLRRLGKISGEMKLVIVGITAQDTGRIRKQVSSLRLSESIHFLEGLSEPELQWCYANCEAVVAPSITEGFGLPVAEALLAGCRIVCSDIPAHREVGDGQCRFVPLRANAEEALAATIAEAVREPKRQPMLLPKFSAPVLAEQYMSLYRQLIVSAAPAAKATLSASINVAATERQPQ